MYLHDQHYERPLPHEDLGLLATKVLHEHVHGGLKFEDEQVPGDPVDG